METVLRIALIYGFLLFALRVLGKREFGQLSPLELLTLLMIPEIVSQALVGPDYSMVNALVGVATLLVLVFGTSLVVHRFERAEHVLVGQPTVLVHHGRLIERALNEQRVTPGEILVELHRTGLTAIEQIEWAILESDGTIAIVPTDEARSRHRAKPRGTDQKTIA